MSALAELLARSPLPPQQAASIAAQLAAALRDRATPHLQLGPNVVRVDWDGDRPLVSLADPGTAADTSFLAPEQWGGGQVGAPADVYSTGAILYHLLTGAPPARPPEALDLRAVAPQLREVLSRALAPDPAQRLADSDALFAALLRAHQALAEAGSTRLARRVGVAAVLALVIGGVALAWARPGILDGGLLGKIGSDSEQPPTAADPVAVQVSTGSPVATQRDATRSPTDTGRQDAPPPTDTGRENATPPADTGRQDTTPAAGTGREDTAPPADTGREQSTAPLDTGRREPTEARQNPSPSDPGRGEVHPLPPTPDPDTGRRDEAAPVDTGREPATDPVDTGREPTTDPVDTGREPATDPVDTGREPATDPVDTGREPATDPVDTGREATAPAQETGRVDPSQVSTPAPADPDVEGHRLPSGRRVALLAISAGPVVLESGARVSVRAFKLEAEPARLSEFGAFLDLRLAAGQQIGSLIPEGEQGLALRDYLSRGDALPDEPLRSLGADADAAFQSWRGLRALSLPQKLRAAKVAGVPRDEVRGALPIR